MVFSGEYTNPENRVEMVDVVLGLYAMVLHRKSAMSGLASQEEADKTATGRLLDINTGFT